MAKIELLMSVMHQKDLSLPKLAKANSDVLVINQCDADWQMQDKVDGNKWRMISTTDRGLSKSRNMAIENAKGDICKLCDDDEILAENYAETIINAYNSLPDADVIIFNLNRINYSMKKPYYKINDIRPAPKFRSYGSPMITFKLHKIISHNIHFNEEFGSGSKFGGGEDNLFINDLRKAGLKIYEHPAIISTIDYGRFGSKWFHGYDEKYFYNLGVFHQYTNSGNIFSNILWGLYLSLKLRREKLNPWKIIKWRLAGSNGYKNGKLSYEEYLTKYK